MTHDKREIPYINRAKQLCSNVRGMDATVSDQELAMTVLCGLPGQHRHLIIAIDAVADDDRPTLEFVRADSYKKSKELWSGLSCMKINSSLR